MKKEAIFAGGCFWCNEATFEATPGVIGVISGFTGGEESNPTYEQVHNGKTQHRESVKVIYDPRKISYGKLVELFWKQIDPTDATGQFYDRGHQYTTAIYYQTKEEKEIAEKSKSQLEKSKRFDKPIVTEILPAKKFWPAEEEHQDFYKKHVLQYKIYKKGSGREKFQEENWT
jgi:peptide methionine sulfoxide reductase msrA/msrB